MGAMVAFVMWVLAIALVYALVQSQAQGGALAGVARVTALRATIFAGQSALEEASYVIRHPTGSGSNVLDALRGRTPSGPAHEPEVTRALYRKLHADGVSGEMTISTVNYELVAQPEPPPPPPPGTTGTPRTKPPWLIELSVRVDYRAGPIRLSRQVRRRYIGHEVSVKEMMGPRKGQIVLTAVFLKPEVYLEVSGP